MAGITNGRQYSCIMGKDDYLHERYHRCLNKIARYPSCTKHLFNELVRFAINQAQTQEIILYSRPGWHEFPNGEVLYAYEPKDNYIPHKLLSKGVKLYKLMIPMHSPDMIISNWEKAVQCDGRLTFCGMYRCSSRLKYFISQAGVHKTQIPILAPSENCKEESLTAIFSTRDFSEVPVTNLVDGEKAVVEEQGYNCDGVSLYVDHSFADEGKKVVDALKAIIRSNEKDDRSLPVVISQNAALTAMKLAPNVFLPIDTTGVMIKQTPEELQITFAGLFNFKQGNPKRPLSVVVDEVQNHNMSVSSPIRKILKEGRKYRLSIIASTQDFYARSTEIGSALGKADMQIHHRPTQDSANLVAAELRWKKSDMVRFDSMNRGDVIIKGALYNKEQKRNVQTTISGHIVDFPAEEQDGAQNNN